MRNAVLLFVVLLLSVSTSHADITLDLLREANVIRKACNPDNYSRLAEIANTSRKLIVRQKAGCEQHRYNDEDGSTCLRHLNGNTSAASRLRLDAAECAIKLGLKEEAKAHLTELVTTFESCGLCSAEVDKGEVLLKTLK